VSAAAAGAGLLARVGFERPVVQAGMGGGLSRHELAAAVAEAGGLGTIGLLDPAELRAEIAAFRRLSERPVAVNLLLPLARAAHFTAAAAADVVVTFWGHPRRRVGITWIHQCGSVAEALAAHDAGADAVIAQGVEAGGHVRGTAPALALLAAVREQLPDDYPVLSAGGVVDADDAAARIAAGAEAVVCGTRFLMTEQSGAHPLYKQRLLGAQETILTELFGMGWPAPHRVVANAATARWLRGDLRGPGWMRAMHRASAPLAARVPVALQMRAAAAQRPGTPLLGPAAATVGGPASLVDAGPLYAGECIARIDDIADAGDVVRALSGS
jgi:NAD(P)H-dependent flavin oxidoreductase YrpB (nitropropane dioxygenase family)